MKRVITVSLIPVLFFTACLPPLSKEAYLMRYEQFITSVRENRGNQDFCWTRADNSFERYSRIYYARFKDQLTLSERVIVGRHNLEYRLMRTHSEVNILQPILYDDFIALRNQAENYIEHQMVDQIRFFLREVNALTDLLARAARQALKAISFNGSSIQ